MEGMNQTAPTEVTGCILDAGQDAKTEILAKAMKGDRDKCIQAGASDYITKPVDLEQLFSVLRVWIVRGHDIPTDPSALEESTATSL